MKILDLAIPNQEFVVLQWFFVGRYSRDPKSKETGEELYEILNDAGETKNFAKKYPEVASGLKERVLAWKAKLPKQVHTTGKYRHQY